MMCPEASPSESGAAVIASRVCAFDLKFGIFDYRRDKHKGWLVLSFIFTIAWPNVQPACA